MFNLKSKAKKITIVQINSCNNGSTGNVVYGIAKCAREAGYDVLTYERRGRSQWRRRKLVDNRSIGFLSERMLSNFVNSQTGYRGSLNLLGTWLFLRDLDRVSPSIVHIHNIHGDFINIWMLFNYIKEKNIKLVWTLHDCWPFTGGCPHFEMMCCHKWETECYDCNYTGYPASRIDRAQKLYNKKKKYFLGLAKEQMHIVTPSNWLSKLVQKSFLRQYSIRVINNGIDLEKFKPQSSNFRKEYGIGEKFLLLGVAEAWGEKKGLDRFERLSCILDPSLYQIVLIGIAPDSLRTKNIICIARTWNQKRLAEIYTAADVFLNPTREDNFPTVNIEALACGTPVLSYGAGGSAEAFDEYSGCVVSDENIIETIERLRKSNFLKENCINRSRNFNRRLKSLEYLCLYKELMEI